MSNRILALDTSNYTTSACLFDTIDGVIWEKRYTLRVKDGECGVRQNEAVFLHNQALGDLFSDFKMKNIDCIAATSCPSERENSYMPCFTVGMSFGKALSKILKVPFFSCSHQKNHICAAVYSAAVSTILNVPFLAYHISGGTTDVCLCLPDKKNVFSVKRIGGTADISCGQLIDRVGVKMDLPFPCGRRIELMAKPELKGKGRIKNTNGLYNFSGFQNKAEEMMLYGEDPADIATYTLDVVYSFILDSIQYFRDEYGNLPVIMSGGVMSNTIISDAVSATLKNVYFSEPFYSSDHALGTAYLCARERGYFND